jgi:uncharacterized membrane protein YgaE (UPF0421/DUF939 family)
VRSDRVHRALLFLCAISAAACVAELFWLRSTQVTVTRPIVALLFLPWLAAATANLGVWYSTLLRSPPTPLNKISKVLFWIVAVAFALAFLGLYLALLFRVL